MAAKLMILAGPPCSGKSTLAGVIESRLGFRWLQVDRILSGLMPDSQRGKGDRNVGYRAMHMMAAELLRCDRSAVLDATYGSTEHREAVEALAVRLETPLFLIECHVSPDTAVARFKNRSDHPALDLTEHRVRDLAERYRYSAQGLTMTAGLNQAEMLRRVESYLCQAEPLNVDGSWSASALGYVS